MHADQPQENPQPGPQVVRFRATILTQVLDTEHRSEGPDRILAVSDADAQLVPDVVPARPARAHDLGQRLRSGVRVGVQLVRPAGDVTVYNEAAVPRLNQD